MFYIGVSLMVWLAAGFLTGIKVVWVDQGLNKENVDKLYAESDDYGKYLTDKFARNKANFVALCTLMGFVTLYAHISGTINKMKRKHGKPHKVYKRYGIQIILQENDKSVPTMKYIESVEINNAAAIRDALDSLTNMEREIVIEIYVEHLKM